MRRAIGVLAAAWLAGCAPANLFVGTWFGYYTRTDATTSSASEPPSVTTTTGQEVDVVSLAHGLVVDQRSGGVGVAWDGRDLRWMDNGDGTGTMVPSGGLYGPVGTVHVTSTSLTYNATWTSTDGSFVRTEHGTLSWQGP